MMVSVLLDRNCSKPQQFDGAPRLTVTVGDDNLESNERHPSESDLAAYAIGKLPPLRSAVIESHLSQCGRCARIVADAPDDFFVKQLQGERAINLLPGGNQQMNNAAQSKKGAKTLQELKRHPRYRIIRKIGTGGMASVYLAEHRILKNSIAIKTIHPDRAREKEIIDRFLQEAKAVSRLNHSNIARVIDVEMMGDSPIMAMEYVPGKTLSEMVALKGPLPIHQACHYVRQVALGLQHAFDRGVIHRDIKPQNLMLNSKGIVKILDFGLGRIVEGKRTHRGITKDNEMLGTPHYVAPEQARDAKSADIRSDIYSLGCTFYFLLTGQAPFSGQSVLEVLAKHEYELAIPVTSLRPDIPHAVAELLEQMLAKDPSYRPQSPKQVANTLSTYAAVSNTVTRDQSPSLPEKSVTESLRSLGETIRLVNSPRVVLPLLMTLACLMASLWK